MRLVVFTEPQLGASYADQLRVAQHAEELGFDAFFRSDHYLTMGSSDGLPGPTDSWVTLGALAVQTTRIRLGTLVTAATFRYPGPLAVSVAQVDQMSGGRVELGLGAGWYEAEHRAYAIPFPPTGERFDRLEEQLAIVTGLWHTSLGERFTFSGRYYEVVDSPGLPKPVQRPGPPVIVGCCPRRRPSHVDGPRRRRASGPRRSAGSRRCSVPRPRWSTRSAGSPSWAPPGCSCRFSTCPTWTTSTSSHPTWPPS